MARTDRKDPSGQPPTKRARARAGASRPRTRASRPDLHPDVIGAISTFLDVGADMKALLLAVGPDNAKSIKKAYLKRNVHFLRRSEELCAASANASKRRFNIRQWTEVNTDWRSMCHENMLLSGEEYDVAAPLSPEGLRIWLTEVRGMTTFNRYAPLSDGSKGPCEKADLIRNVGDALISVDGQSTSNKPIEDVVSMLKEITTKKSANSLTCAQFVNLRFIDSTFYACFCNPATAVDLDLVDVLRFLVEERGIDVNDTTFSKQSPKPLLARALTRSDQMFEYMLSVHGIDCNCELGIRRGSVEAGTAVLHYAVSSGTTAASRLKTLLEHEGVDIHLRDVNGRNALHYAVSHSLDDNAVAKIRLLLEAGVDPNIRCNSGLSPLGYFQRRIRRGDEQAMGRKEVVLFFFWLKTRPDIEADFHRFEADRYGLHAPVQQDFCGLQQDFFKSRSPS